jgi:hypothetical protein
MNRSLPSVNTIRQYLLGRLDEHDLLERSLSEQILFDDELAEVVDSVEDEIIEDYLDGTLNAADQKSVVQTFLLPPQRQEKLQFARLMRSRFQGQAVPAVKKPAAILSEPGPEAARLPGNHAWTMHWKAHRRTYCEVACLLLLSASSIIYISRLQERVDGNAKQLAQLKAEAAQANAVSANLQKQLEGLQPPLASLVLLFPTRGPDDPVSRVKILPWTKKIAVQITIESAAAGTWNVRLENGARQQIWSGTNIQSLPRQLSFEMPVQGIVSGEYWLTVSSQQPHSETSYGFFAQVSK